MDKIKGVVIIGFLGALAGVIVSMSLLYEDILSTANTIAEYFPVTFGVIPATTHNGAMIIGAFTSIAQIVGAVLGFNKSYDKKTRTIGKSFFFSFMIFDAWTDVVHRSGWFTGDLPIAISTTLVFYTLGSEFLQGLSWLIIGSTWRKTITEIMWGTNTFLHGMRTIRREWVSLSNAAQKNADRNMVNSVNAMAATKAPYTTPRSTSSYPTSRSASSLSNIPGVSKGFGANNDDDDDDDFPNVRPLAKPAPKPVSSRQTSFMPPEPTYHPVGYDAQSSDGAKRYNA